jgi:hypothetical protein
MPKEKKPKIVKWKQALGDQYPYVDVDMPKEKKLYYKGLKKMKVILKT